ncbi:hypothetical protein TNCV_3008021 [Trichonephila clavipes]|nr:hypothetical protein TNCV_3008021 [Trichonephila clavipes]
MTVQELLDFHNQELTMDELTEMQEQDVESSGPVQSEDGMTVPIGRRCTHYSAITDDKLVTLTSLGKMWTPQQKVQCVLWLTEFKSVMWAVGSLVVRASDSRPEGLGLPPNTLRVHTEYVLVNQWVRSLVD